MSDTSSVPSGVESALAFSTADMPSEPIAFSIDGEVFHARPWITGHQFLRYSRDMASGSIASVVMVETFFAECMEPADHERFIKFIEDPARRVSTQTLLDVFLGIFARYSSGAAGQSRPTEPSNP